MYRKSKGDVEIEDFQAMMAAGDRLPAHIKYWTWWMQAILYLAPIAFVRHAPARWLILAQVINTIIAYIVFVSEGNQVTRIFGLGHLVWIFPALMLAVEINSNKWIGYRVFAALAVATIMISLGFDFVDIFRWIKGDRASTLMN